MSLQRVGNIFNNSGSDQNLFGTGNDMGQPIATCGIQFSKHIIQDQDRT